MSPRANVDQLARELASMSREELKPRILRFKSRPRWSAWRTEPGRGTTIASRRDFRGTLRPTHCVSCRPTRATGHLGLELPASLESCHHEEPQRPARPT